MAHWGEINWMAVDADVDAEILRSAEAATLKRYRAALDAIIGTPGRPGPTEAECVHIAQQARAGE